MLLMLLLLRCCEGVFDNSTSLWQLFSAVVSSLPCAVQMAPQTVVDLPISLYFHQRRMLRVDY
jgi:hypothetical protein